MILPISPPRLRPKRAARKATLTPTQEIELLAWDKARRYLGTYKTKARELGMKPFALKHAVQRLRAREI